MLTLYDYWRSGTSHRLRIALALKGLDYAQVSVDLIAAAQRSDEHLARNPQGLVPVLIADGETLTQSPAIIERTEQLRIVLRQTHGLRDVENLGRTTLESRPFNAAPL